MAAPQRSKRNPKRISLFSREFDQTFTPLTGLAQGSGAAGPACGGLSRGELRDAGAARDGPAPSASAVLNSRRVEQQHLFS
jgi:hypothetical protein